MSDKKLFYVIVTYIKITNTILQNIRTEMYIYLQSLLSASNMIIKATNNSYNYNNNLQQNIRTQSYDTSR